MKNKSLSDGEKLSIFIEFAIGVGASAAAFLLIIPFGTDLGGLAGAIISFLIMVCLTIKNLLQVSLTRTIAEKSNELTKEIITLSNKVAIEQIMRTYAEIPSELQEFAKSHLSQFDSNI